MYGNPIIIPVFDFCSFFLSAAGCSAYCAIAEEVGMGGGGGGGLPTAPQFFHSVRLQ